MLRQRNLTVAGLTDLRSLRKVRPLLQPLTEVRTGNSRQQLRNETTSWEDEGCEALRERGEITSGRSLRKGLNG